MRQFFIGLLFCCFSPWAGAQTPVPPTAKNLVEAAYVQTLEQVQYNPSYFRINYPMGDVPAQFGVCTDVVIRAYRALGIDLQQRVHEDMAKNFHLYPKIWGATKTDTNIDHRRVPNLQVFFQRFGHSLKVTDQANDYQPGDIVTWNLRGDQGSLPHIGIVSDRRAADESRPLIIHNIGQGPQIEDMLFDYPITGHYRYGFGP